MAKRVCFLSALLVLMSVAAFAQDARAVLQAASTAMGGNNLKTIQYSGTGFTAAVGQSYDVMNEDWPRFEITRYTRTIDYDARTSIEDYTRRQGNYPPRGGGFTPLIGEQQQLFMVKGNFDAWNMNGNTAVPQPALAEIRQLEIWLTPHGFLKAAQANNATAFTRMQGGKQATIVSFMLGKYRMNATINDQNLIEHVQTWVPNPVLGDMAYEIRYTEWKDFGGVKFPTLIHVHNGNRFLIVSDDAFELHVTTVQGNVAVPPVKVPDAVLTAGVPPVRVQSQRLADGVWLIGGGSHNSVLVEFRDYVAVVEAPLNEERSLAVITEVRKLVPNKPIQYVVNTHHHFDHSGGLRTYVSEGVTVIAHETNRKLYENVVFYPAPRTLEPDRLSLYPVPTTVGGDPTVFETLKDKYVVSDGKRILEVYALQGVAHSESMLVAYLPAEKILINADMYTPPAAGQPAPAPNPGMTTLFRNMQRLKLDVAQHVPIHGQPGAGDEFVRIMNRSSN
jgi:glyoxylase-like metal-dependent hydrolase (beta-lactamase superfamily II)